MRLVMACAAAFAGLLPAARCGAQEEDARKRFTAGGTKVAFAPAVQVDQIKPDGLYQICGEIIAARAAASLPAVSNVRLTRVDRYALLHRAYHDKGVGGSNPP